MIPAEHYEATQSALTAILLQHEGRHDDLWALLESMPKPVRWHLVMSLVGLSTAWARAHCADHGVDPAEFLRGAILSADPSVALGGDDD